MNPIKIGMELNAGGHLDAEGEDVSPAGTTEISDSCSLKLLNTNYDENETLTKLTNTKKNSNRNENQQNIIQISIQNIRTLTEFKCDVLYNIINESKSSIFSLTEISLNTQAELIAVKKLKKLGKIITCSKEHGYLRNGIITIVKYPLVSH